MVQMMVNDETIIFYDLFVKHNDCCFHLFSIQGSSGDHLGIENGFSQSEIKRFFFVLPGGGGPRIFNPWPLGPFLLVLGEAETSSLAYGLCGILDLLLSRMSILEELWM